VTFVYDSNGNRSLLSDWTGRTTSTYDKLNRVDTTTEPGVPALGIPSAGLGYAYDKVGQRKRLINPDGAIYTSVYDPAGRLKTLQNPKHETTTFGYDAAGQMTTKLLANVTKASMVYDDAGNLDRVLNLDNVSATISDFTYGFDGIGDRSSGDDPNGEYSNWNYDGIQELETDLYFIRLGLARLTLPQWKWFTVNDWYSLPVDILGTRTYTYTYDPAGNRTSQREINSGETVVNSYDDVKRVVLPKLVPTNVLVSVTFFRVTF
jgi:YD repeat-containing protein